MKLSVVLSVYNGARSLSATLDSIIDQTINRPNGITLSPDERTLYVANTGGESVVRCWGQTPAARASASKASTCLPACRSEIAFSVHPATG